MKPIDIILIVALALIAIGIIAFIIRKKIKGEKIGCGCGCHACPHAGACSGNTKEKNSETNEKNGGEENDKTL